MAPTSKAIIKGCCQKKAVIVLCCHQRECNGGREHDGGKDCSLGSERDEWRHPMEGGSMMEGEISQREKCVEEGSAMEGGRRATGMGNRDGRQETGMDGGRRATAKGDK